MSCERELLERALEGLNWYEYKDLMEEIRAYLADTNPSETINSQEVDRSEPVAWTNQDELNALGTDVTCYMYAEPLVGENNIPLYLHPAPCPEFVRLSEEEIMAIVRADPDFDEMMWDKTAVRFARAIENALEAKNS